MRPLERQRGLIELPVVDDSRLRDVCLKEDALEELAERGRRDTAAHEHRGRGALIEFCERRRHRQAHAQLAHRHDHAQHERVGGDARARLAVTWHAAEEGKELCGHTRPQPLLDGLALLRLGEWRKGEPAETAEAAVTHARRARGAQHQVPLAGEHVRDVALDGVAAGAALVEPIEQQERAARHERLP